LLDPGTGGVISANFEYLQARLSERGMEVEKTALYHVLDRLIEKGELERVKTEDGGAVYTRPSVLLRTPGLASVLPGTPAMKVRQRASTSDRAYELRSEKAIIRGQDRMVARGAHDHRPNHKCPVCGVITPKIYLREGRPPVSQ
jgi:hypothetical protein